MSKLTPKTIRIDAATICQLKCPSCPTASGDIAKFVGSGLLKFDDFKMFIDKNPWIENMDLSNWGEIFLNPELVRILEYAAEKNVTMGARNGVNLNNAKPEVLEALVKTGFRAMTVSIDGATPEVYAIYRVKGSLDAVLNNVRMINEFKKKHNSKFPELIWQFVVFGHNEHEIEIARAMAEELDMFFFPKLNWEDLYDRPYSPVEDKELVRGTFGAADRTEYIAKFGEHFCATSCRELWLSPQVNFDGEVLGCPINHWSSFGNAFKDDLLEIINSDRMNHARLMVQGLAPERADVACSDCKIYKQMKAHGAWTTAPPEPEPVPQPKKRPVHAQPVPAPRFRFF